MESIESSDINPSSRCHLCDNIVPMHRMYCDKCIDKWVEREYENTNARNSSPNHRITTNLPRTI